MRRIFAILVSCAGCGDGGRAADGPVAPEGVGGLVSFQFLSDLSPLGDNAIYFQNADSSLVLAGRTAGDGRANAFMSPGGVVTLIVRRGNLVALFTHVGVRPGDELVVDERATTTNAMTTPFQIRVPADPDATFYDLATSCGSADIRGAELAPLSIGLGECNGRADMLVRSFGNGVRYIYRDDVGISPATTVLFTGPYQSFETARIVATGADAATEGVTIIHSLIGGSRELSRAEVTISPASSSISTGIDVPLPTTGISMIRIDPFPSGAVSSEHVIEWGPSAQTSVIDIAPSLRTILDSPRVDLERRAVVWTESSQGKVADAVLATFQWTPPDSTDNYQWNVVAPRTDDPILRLPLLPRSELVPQGNLIDPYVFATISSEGGYDSFRSHILGAWSPGRVWPIEAPAGRVVYRNLGF